MADETRMRTVFLRVQVDLPDGFDATRVVNTAATTLADAFKPIGGRNAIVGTVDDGVFQTIAALEERVVHLEAQISAGRSEGA